MQGNILSCQALPQPVDTKAADHVHIQPFPSGNLSQCKAAHDMAGSHARGRVGSDKKKRFHDLAQHTCQFFGLLPVFFRINV